MPESVADFDAVVIGDGGSIGGGVRGKLAGVGDGCFVLEVVGIRSGRGRCATVGHTPDSDTVRLVWTPALVRCANPVRSAGGWRRRSGLGEVEVAAVTDGDEQFGPAGAPMEGDGEQCERHDPHGSQPW